MVYFPYRNERNSCEGRHCVQARHKLGKQHGQNFIYLPRQDLMPMQRRAEISHLWAEWYLFYTLFTPFDWGRNTPLKERTKDMIRILFVCWGKRFLQSEKP